MSSANHDSNQTATASAGHILPNRLHQLANARFGRPSRASQQAFGTSSGLPTHAPLWFVKIHEIRILPSGARWHTPGLHVRKGVLKSREG